MAVGAAHAPGTFRVLSREIVIRVTTQGCPRIHSVGDILIRPVFSYGVCDTPFFAFRDKVDREFVAVGAAHAPGTFRVFSQEISLRVTTQGCREIITVGDILIRPVLSYGVTDIPFFAIRSKVDRVPTAQQYVPRKTSRHIL